MGGHTTTELAFAGHEGRARTGSFSCHESVFLVDIQHEELSATLNYIDAALDAGQRVYLHCWGGIGRTGTVVGCHLVRHGLTGAEALALIARLRARTPDGGRRSPETEAQRAMVLGWAES